MAAKKKKPDKAKRCEKSLRETVKEIVAKAKPEKAVKPEIEARKRTGDVTDYNEKIATEICKRISEGESLRAICRDIQHPTISTVLLWLHKAHKGIEPYVPFSEQYARAREAQADVLFDECVDIADQGKPDHYIDEVTGELRVDGDAIQRAKLRIETRRWMAGKMKPKVYGDKILHGSDPENPLPPPVEQVVKFNSPQEAADAFYAMVKKHNNKG